MRIIQIEEKQLLGSTINYLTHLEVIVFYKNQVFFCDL